MFAVDICIMFFGKKKNPPEKLIYMLYESRLQWIRFD